jgi:uncharacterized protein YoxC
MEEIHVSPGTLGAALVSGAVTFLAWIIRVAAREALAGLKQSIDHHARTIDSLAHEVKEMRAEVSDLKTRVVRVETWHENDG